MAVRCFRQEVMTALWRMTTGRALMCWKLIRLGFAEMAQTMNHRQCRGRLGQPPSFPRNRFLLQVVTFLNLIEFRLGLLRYRIWLVPRPLFDGRRPVLQVMGRAQTRYSQLMVELTGNSNLGLVARKRRLPASIQPRDTHRQWRPFAATDLADQTSPVAESER